MKIEKIYISSLEDVMNMQDEIYDYMEDKEALQKVTREEMTSILSDEYSVGVFKEQKLVAMRGFYIPEYNEEEHLADDAFVDRDTTIYSEIALVHPDARGQNLQLKMGEVLLEDLRNDKRFNHLISTVMPLNFPSLKNSLKLGLKIVNTKLKYGGKRRHILYLNLNKKLELKGEPIYIKQDDIDWMLANGKDYIGTDIVDGYIKYYKK